MKYVLLLGKAVYPLYYLIEYFLCSGLCSDISADKSPKLPWGEDDDWCNWVSTVIYFSVGEPQMEAITLYLQVQILA